jgi:hypothetical protein
MAQQFKSIARLELPATNGNTVRFDIGPDGAIKVNARKGAHNQSVSVLTDADRRALLAWLTGDAVADAVAVADADAIADAVADYARRPHSH